MVLCADRVSSRSPFRHIVSPSPWHSGHRSERDIQVISSVIAFFFFDPHSAVRCRRSGSAYYVCCCGSWYNRVQQPDYSKFAGRWQRRCY